MRFPATNVVTYSPFLYLIDLLANDFLQSVTKNQIVFHLTSASKRNNDDTHLGTSLIRGRRLLEVGAYFKTPIFLHEHL